MAEQMGRFEMISEVLRMLCINNIAEIQSLKFSEGRGLCDQTLLNSLRGCPSIRNLYCFRE